MPNNIISAPRSVLHVASECSPWSGTGGLGEVSRDLPVAQADVGAYAIVLSPSYRDLTVWGSARDIAGGRTRLGGWEFDWRVVSPATAEHIWLLDIPALFHRPTPYSVGGSEYPDNIVRFAFLCAVAVELVQRFDFQVLHAHDWQSAFAVAWLKEHGLEARAVYTIHNLAFQGRFSAAWAELLGLSAQVRRHSEYYAQLNLTKLALRCADAVTTVSPQYAKEILTPEFGEGLEGVLRHDVRSIEGILNGVGDSWDPLSDPALDVHFDVNTVANRAAARRRLLADAGVRTESSATMVVMSCRWTWQKGVDLALGALHEVLRDTDIVVLLMGSGDHQLEDRTRELVRAHPGRVAWQRTWSDRMHRRWLGAADLLLMPSRFEPCGLTQLQAMRYGTLPVVTPVGGLVDTVRDCRLHADGTGFVCPTVDLEGVAQTLRIAAAARDHRDAWQKAMRCAMTREFSWQSAAERYLSLYHELLRNRP
jgi:starch synthase